jgi:5-methylcytosine-specific restriction endonuclease McrA
VTRIGGDYRPVPKPTKRPKRIRRNDGEWRAGCLVMRGRYCRACAALGIVPAGPAGGRLELDHIWPKGQGGPSVVANGLVLCQRHHEMKTNSEIQIDPAWLDRDQLDWLQEVGWVWWNAAGEPVGRGLNHFLPRTVRAG